MPDNLKITPGYIIFYILFSVNTWRLALSVVFSLLLTPQLLKTRAMTLAGTAVLYVMMTVIGWAITAYPARKIAFFLRKWILKENLPS